MTEEIIGNDSGVSGDGPSEKLHVVHTLEGVSKLEEGVWAVRVNGDLSGAGQYVQKTLRDMGYNFLGEQTSKRTSKYAHFHFRRNGGSQ